MLDDRASLPPDVALLGDCLRDEALDTDYPISGSTTMFLELLKTGLTMREVADTVADRFGEPIQRIRQDLVGLVLRLNRARLINIDSPRSPVVWLSRWVVDLLISVRTGRRFPEATRRYQIDRRNAASITRSIAAVVLIVKAPQWVTLAVVSLLAGLLFGTPLLPILLGLEAAVIATMVTHETGHALAACHWSRGCFLIASRRGPVAVVHPPCNRDAWTNAAGPAAGAACGILLLGVGLVTQSLVLAVGAIPGVLNLLGFTVLFRDGRQLVRNSWRLR